MPEQRTPIEDVTPTNEDWGIFKGSIVTVQLHLTPLRRSTTRNDLLCVGFLGGTRVEVVFPGRRRKDAVALEADLDAYLRAKSRAARAKGLQAPHVISIRFPLSAEGVWRVRLDEAGDDDVERVYQFMAARWTWLDPEGGQKSSGETPIGRPITRMPAF